MSKFQKSRVNKLLKIEKKYKELSPKEEDYSPEEQAKIYKVFTDVMGDSSSSSEEQKDKSVRFLREAFKVVKKKNWNQAPVALQGRISKNRVSFGDRRVTADHASPSHCVHMFNLLLISGEKQSTSPEAIVDEARITTWTDILDSNVSSVASDNESGIRGQ